ARHPRDLDAWTMLGDIDLFLGEGGPAAACYERALAGGAESLRIRLNLASAWENAGHPERAIPSLRRAGELAQASGDMQLARAVAARIAARHPRGRADAAHRPALSRPRPRARTAQRAVESRAGIPVGDVP